MIAHFPYLANCQAALLSFLLTFRVCAKILNLSVGIAFLLLCSCRVFFGSCKFSLRFGIVGGTFAFSRSPRPPSSSVSIFGVQLNCCVASSAGSRVVMISTKKIEEGQELIRQAEKRYMPTTTPRSIPLQAPTSPVELECLHAHPLPPPGA